MFKFKPRASTLECAPKTKSIQANNLINNSQQEEGAASRNTNHVSSTLINETLSEGLRYLST
jgi:hypothetical protein